MQAGEQLLEATCSYLDKELKREIERVSKTALCRQNHPHYSVFLLIAIKGGASE